MPGATDEDCVLEFEVPARFMRWSISANPGCERRTSCNSWCSDVPVPATTNNATFTYIAAAHGHTVMVESWPLDPAMVESWPLDRRPSSGGMASGAGALSELRDYRSPSANRMTRNCLPILYKPEMVTEIWKFLHKPRYVDVGQLDRHGRTAARVAAGEGHTDIVELLQGLGVEEGADFEDEGGSDDNGE